MKPFSSFAVLLLGLAVSGLASAQSAPAPQRAPLDANGDGVIDRAEAAARPRLAERFDQLDTNHDGKLDASERPQRGEHRRGRGEGGGRFGIAAADRDGDGRISRAEAASLKRVSEHFDEIDRNRDGYLVRSEVRAYFESQRPKWEAERAKRSEARFAAADLNHDGRLSRAEVEAAMPRLAQSFAFLDEDRDGYLNRSDLKPPSRH